MHLSEIVACLQCLAVHIDEVCLLGGDEGFQRFLVSLKGNGIALLHDLAHEDHVGQGGEACILCHISNKQRL